LQLFYIYGKIQVYSIKFTKEEGNYYGKEKILKFIFIIILTLIIIYGIYVARNYIIISKIAKRHEEYMKNTNYSYIINISRENVEPAVKVEIEGFSNEEDVVDGGVETVEGYYKDGKGIEIMKSAQQTGMVWYNENTKESIFFEPQKLTAILEPVKDDVGAQFGKREILDKVNYITNNKIKKALNNSIKYTEINGEKCYAITNNFGILSTAYISVERGILLKCVTGNVTIECKEWKINTVTDQDVSKPNLAGYEITDYR